MEEENLNNEIQEDLEEKANKLEQEIITTFKDTLPKFLINNFLGDSWSDKLYQEFSKEYMVKLGQYIQREREINTVYPSKEDMFNIFRLCKFEDVKLCIVVDEYCFTDSIIISKELNDLFVTIEQTFYDGFKLDFDHSLNNWCGQGIFVLPRVMTSINNKPGAHVGKGWETFTNEVIKLLKDKDILILENPDSKQLLEATVYTNKKYNINIKW